MTNDSALKPPGTTLARPVAVAATLLLVTAFAAPASAASLMRSVDVKGSSDVVWSKIGGFCAIKDWHPAIGTCTLSGKSPVVRTLVTKDGKATFVETETAHSNARHLYSYAIKSSPLPISHYTSTIKVTPNGKGISTVTWSSTYTPDAGKESAANDALSGIYEAGLDGIKSKLAQ